MGDGLSSFLGPSEILEVEAWFPGRSSCRGALQHVLKTRLFLSGFVQITSETSKIPDGGGGKKTQVQELLLWFLNNRLKPKDDLSLPGFAEAGI